MAKSKNRRRRDYTTHNTIARRTRLPFSYSWSPKPAYLVPNNYLTMYEDRRTWHPERFYRSAASFTQARHRLTLLDQPQWSPPRHNNYVAPRLYTNLTNPIVFQKPDRVLICVRRTMRREVLHALRKNGRRGQKPPRRNFFSTISCRRS